MKKRVSLLVILCLMLSLCLPCAVAQQERDLEGTLVILHTNDVHGRAVETLTEPAMGYARIAKARQRYIERGAQVLLLDAGDAVQGMPIVNLDQGMNAITFMNAAGYDAMTIGNHELDYGMDRLLQLKEAMTYPLLCANIVRDSDGELPFASNHIFEMEGGIKVGVFGLATPETMTKANPAYTLGYTIYQDQALYDCAQKQVEQLKAQGASLIVCLGHLGVNEESAPNRSYDVIDHVTGIDLFIDGHSHTELGEMRGETLLVSTGCYGHNLGVVTLKDGKLDGSLIPAIDQDTELAKQITSIDREITDRLSKPFAKTTVALNGAREDVRSKETNLGDFAADAILWAAQNVTGRKVDMAISNGGDIRSSIPVGDICMLDMKTVFPYSNTLSIVEVKGAELLEIIEAATFAAPDLAGAFPQVAGMRYTVDTTKEYIKGEVYDHSTYYAPAKPGTRVTINEVGGAAFDPEKLYMVALSDYLASGGDTYVLLRYLSKTAGIDTGYAMEDALISYLEHLGNTVGEEYASPQGRITIIQ